MPTDHPAPDSLLAAMSGAAPLPTPTAVLAPGAHRMTTRQQAFLEVAIELDEEGKTFVRDWLTATRGEEKPWEGPPVTMSEWKGWLQLDGFHAAFYGSFPLGREVDGDDLDGMDVLFWDSLRKGVTAGNMRALELHAKVRGLTRREDDDGPVINIQTLIADGGSSKWRRKRVGDEAVSE